MAAGLITIDSIQKGLSTETGVNFKPSDFFLSKIMDGFSANARHLQTETQQKNAIYALANSVAKFAAAQVDFKTDYDCLDIVFRGGIPCISMQTRLVPRLLARRGYIYTDFFAAIAPGSAAKFTEVIAGGRRVVIFSDDSKQQPTINIANILNGNIDHLAIRVSIGKDANSLIDFAGVIPVDEIIAAANASEKGIYQIERYLDDNKKWKRRIKTDANGNKLLNTVECPWTQYTSEMVKKVCVRRLQKVIIETFPEIADVQGLTEEGMDADTAPIKVEEIKPIEEISPEEYETNIDFEKPSESQTKDMVAAHETYKKLPEQIIDDLEKIKADFPEPLTQETMDENRENIIAKHFVTLALFRKYPSLHKKRPDLFETFKWLIA